MNKLYILGALLLSSVSAYKLTAGKDGGDKTWTDILTLGSYTYTISGDCFSAATATTLGMNNKYY